VPDLAIVTYGDTIEAAKQAAREAIQINLETYREVGQVVPESQSIEYHLDNPEVRELVFAYVEVQEPESWIAA
jgi:predicted RNase H-like HicB family nuclease